MSLSSINKINVLQEKWSLPYPTYFQELEYTSEFAYCEGGCCALCKKNVYSTLIFRKSNKWT